MALVQFGAGITKMSGSIAGTTFARNRSGNYARARGIPTNPNTALQQAARSALNILTVRWSQTLTPVQRTAWNLYASSVDMQNRIGEAIQLTGQNHYIRSNCMRIRLAVAPVDDGPVIFELPEADPLFSIAASEATQNITITYDDTLEWDNETGGYLLIFQGSPQNAQRNFFDGPWRFLTAVAGVTGVPVASPKITAVQFAMSEGQHQWCYARILRADGRLSSPFRDESFCAA